MNGPTFVFLGLQICALPIIVQSVSMLDFYPFGKENGDTEMPRGQTLSTNEVTSIRPGVPFRGLAYDRTQVSTKGYIKFRTIVGNDLEYWYLTVVQNSVEEFNKGNVFYRQTTDLDLLRSAANEVKKYFPSQNAFSPTWAMVVTWSGIQIINKDDQVTVETKSIVRSDVDICTDDVTTESPVPTVNTTMYTNTTEPLLPTMAPCVNISEATFLQEIAKRVYKERSSEATFQVVITTDGEYTYYVLNFNGIVTCQGTGFESFDKNTKDFKVSRNLVLPGTSNIGEHGKWIQEIGKACPQSFDLMFALDTSGSVGQENIEIVKDVVLYILQQLTLGEDKIRAGIVGFAEEATIVSDLSSSLAVLRSALFSINLSRGPANLASALKTTRQLLSHQNGGRTDVPQIAVVITDSSSTEDPTSQAKLASDEGMVVIVIGIGQGVDFHRLRKVAKEENLMTLFDFRELNALQDMLIDRICRSMPADDPNSQLKDIQFTLEATLSRVSGTMLGGQSVEFFGPCFSDTQSIGATFGTYKTTCKPLNSNVARCITPPLLFAGTVDAVFDVNGYEFNSLFTYESPAWSLPDVARVKPKSWQTDNDVTIMLDPKLIPGDEINIEIIGYKENSENGEVILYPLSTILNGTSKSDTVTFQRPALSDIDGFKLGFIRVSASEEPNVHLWSDIHHISWAINGSSPSACQSWITSERQLPRVDQKGMTQCPCTARQASSDLGRFRRDVSCEDSNRYITSPYCDILGSNNTCFSSVEPSPQGFSQRCCYADDGSLLDPRYLNGGGTSGRYSKDPNHLLESVPKAGAIPLASHMYNDVVPLHDCCFLSNITTECQEYFTLRPSNDCKSQGGYEPSAIGVVDSDPIVSTLDGYVFAFSAVGEFIFLETLNSDLVVQGRVSKSRDGNDKTMVTAVVMSNPAVSRADALQLGVEMEGGVNKFTTRVNGRLWKGELTRRVELTGLTLVTESDSERLVYFHGRQAAIKFIYDGDHVDVLLYLPPSLKGKVRGLLGYYDGVPENDLLSRSGSTLPSNSTTEEIHDQFVLSWKLQDENNSLFSYPKGVTLVSASISDPFYTPGFVTSTDPMLQRVSTEVARLCRESNDCKVILQTKVKSGQELNSTALWSAADSRTSLEKVTVCPFIDPPVDVTLAVTVSGYRVGNVAALSCPEGWSVVGYDRLVCQDSGDWSGHLTYCEGVLFTEPSYGTMLGGQRIAITGPHLTFDHNVIPYAKIGGITVSCEYGGKYVAYCRTPYVDRIGVTTVYVNVMGGSPTGWVYRGEYVYQNAASFPPEVRREDASKWTSKGIYTITWDPEKVNSESVSVELYGYKEDLATGGITWQKLHTFTENHDAKSGSYVIDSSLIDIPADFTVGILKVTPGNGKGSVLWSDVHPLTWVTSMDHKALCRRFTSYDRTLVTLDQFGLIGCPCNVARARSDNTNFKMDVGCMTGSERGVNCLYSPGAEVCFRSIPIGGSEQRCCYDKNGVLLNARDLTGGATPGRYHHDGISPYSRAGTIPHMSHFTNDVMPYLHCCVYSRDFCTDYFAQRRPSDCVSEFPPRPALVEGDPHFVTFDEESFTFDSVGEFVLMRAMNETLVVQGRMETLQNVRGTCFTAFAMKHEDTEMVEVRRASDHVTLEILHDRRLLSFNLTDAREYAYTGITIRVDSPSEVSVSFTHLSFVIDIELVDGLLDAMLSVPFDFSGNTSGLLGVYNEDPNDDLTSRDGVVLPRGVPTYSVHESFGKTWKISKSESLFNYEVGQDYDFYNRRPYKPEYKTGSDIDTRMVSPFVKAMCGGSKECTYDYISKGYLSPAFGNRPRRMRDRFWQRLQDLTTSKSCGFLDTIAEGLIRTVSGYRIGDTIRLSCSPGLRLVGPSVLLCTDRGWDRPEGRCQRPENSTDAIIIREPNPSYSVEETDSTPSWAVGAVVGVVGGVAVVGGTVLVVRGVMVAQQIARIQAYRLMDPKFGTSGASRPSFKPDLL